ncbi:MAG: GNAT family N-acetyltransferase [Methanomassiliicoccus sp.]|nr:GNAT family N-acetyltransferase [Methanomassiliicoccus sp.]
MMLKGDLVGLRPMESEDAWHLFRWFNDQRVLEDLGLRRALFCVSIEEQRKIVEQKLSSPHDRDFMVIDLAEQKAIGWAALSHIDQRNAIAELNVVIGEPGEWDRGKGTEAARMMVDHAFEVMNMHRVHLRVPSRNARAVACFTACGFVIEGTARDDHHHRGRFASSHLMSVLRDEGGRS